MANSDRPSWSHYIKDKNAAEVVRHPHNSWIGAILISLSLRYPWITRYQALEFALLMGAFEGLNRRTAAKRVRLCLNILRNLGILSVPIRTLWRPEVMSNTPALDSARSGFAKSLVSERPRKDGWSTRGMDMAYCLADDAPTLELIRQLKADKQLQAFHSRYAEKETKRSSDRKIAPRLPSLDQTERLREMDFLHWIGIAEVHLAMTRSGHAEAGGLVAVSDRLTAFREGSQLEPIRHLRTPETIDDAFGRLWDEAPRVTREQSTAIAYRPPEKFSFGIENFLETLSQAERWNQYQIW